MNAATRDDGADGQDTGALLDHRPPCSVAMAAGEPRRIVAQDLGLSDYVTLWHAMRAFTAERDSATADTVWLTEHRAVFTQGQAGRAEHVFDIGAIPLVASDRGGQVTYHGPGQLIAYVLFDLTRRRVGVRDLVRLLEASVIGVLDAYGIAAEGRLDAPGVYVAGAKIASVGLRVRHGRTYHGIAFNVDMDLSPFSRINPCGHVGLAMTDARRVGVTASLAVLKQALIEQISWRWHELPAAPPSAHPTL